MSKLNVGDLCVTRNANASLLNNGLLVVILAIDPAHYDGAASYLIRRIDGQRIPSTLDIASGIPRFFSYSEAWSSQHKLRRINPDEVLDRVKKTEHLAEHA